MTVSKEKQNEWDKEFQEYKANCKVFADCDKGPWEVQNRPPNEIVLFSDDFKHDVMLSIKGDFYGEEDKLLYMQKLCDFLNNAKLNVPQQPTKD